MTPSDDLGELWKSEPEQPRDLPALLREVERRSRSFDSVIRRRDWRETAAGLLVTVMFGWFALHARSSLGRLAYLWLSAYGVWVIVYLWRNSRSGKLAPNGDLAEYRAAVLERYDHQIRLLRRVRYWYVLPCWIGMMLSAWAAFRRTGSFAVLVADVSVFTGVSLLVCWLNEVKGVGYVEKEKRKVMKFFGDERQS